MDFLKKIGDACRLHYEKILLTLALLGLAGAVLYLNKAKGDEDDKIKKYVTTLQKKNPAPVKPVDLSGNEAALKLINSPPPLNFSRPHHLFNPVKWQRRPDDTLVKLETGNEIGWPKMILTRSTPLNFIINIDRVINPGQYSIGVTHEGADKVYDRKKKLKFATLHAKMILTTNEFITIQEIVGPAEDPTELVLELTDGAKVSISKDKPYTQVEGYEADLKYTIDGKTFTNLRTNSPIRFLGEDYIVVAIAPNEVVVSARSNDKKFTVRPPAAP